MDAIISGVDGVIVRYDPTVHQDIERRHRLHAGSLLETMHEMPSTKLASVGDISMSLWLRYASETLTPQAVQDWLAYHGRLNPPAVDALHAAKHRGIRLFLVATTTRPVQQQLAHHQIGDLTERTYRSQEVGYAQPDDRFYKHVLRDASLHPSRTLYVDSHPSWIEAGHRLGMRTHLYTTAARLRQALAKAEAGA